MNVLPDRGAVACRGGTGRAGPGQGPGQAARYLDVAWTLGEVRVLSAVVAFHIDLAMAAAGPGRATVTRWTSYAGLVRADLEMQTG